MKCKNIWIALPLCLILAAGVLLAGCSAGGVAVGKVDNDTITVEDVNLVADYILMQNSMTRADITDEADMKSLNDNALETAVMLELVMKKGTAMKLYPLSEASLKEVDDIVAQNADYLPEGMTKDKFKQMETQVMVYQLVADEVNKGVSVTDDEAKAEYDAQVESQKAAFTEDGAAYEGAISDGTTVIVYKPDGYRYVKHILIAMPTETADKITEAQDSGDTKAASTLREQGLAQIKAKAEEVLAKVKAGSDFDALMAEYGEDPGMQQEPASQTGYELGSASGFVPEFLDAALKLGKVGDTTDLVATDYGYHIIKWVGNVPSGPVAYDDVKEDLKASLLQTKQEDAWNEAYEQWEAAAKIEKFPDKIPVVMPTAAAVTAAATGEPEILPAE